MGSVIIPNLAKAHFPPRSMLEERDPTWPSVSNICHDTGCRSKKKKPGACFRLGASEEKSSSRRGFLDLSRLLKPFFFFFLFLALDPRTTTESRSSAWLQWSGVQHTSRGGRRPLAVAGYTSDENFVLGSPVSLVTKGTSMVACLPCRYAYIASVSYPCTCESQTVAFPI